jgi:hypothetical protein
MYKVIDPNGVVLIDETVWNGTNFTFRAFTDGEHELVFDNYGGDDKYIELAYDVNSGIPEMPPMALVITSIVVSSMVVLAKKKGKLGQPQRKSALR